MPPPPPDDPRAGPAAARPSGLADDVVDPTALDRVLREGDYRTRLARDAEDLLRLEATWRASGLAEPSRRFCLRLTEVAERLEYALLDVGARGNRTYAYFAEAVSLARWLAKTVHALLHLRGRIRRFLGERDDLDAFRRDLDGWIGRIAQRTTRALGGVRAEAILLGIPVPASPHAPDALSIEDARWRLPQDLDAADAVDERERIAEAATAFLVLADELLALSVPGNPDAAVLAAFERDTFGDPRAHALRVRLHTIQSAYDTVVAATPLETADPELKIFRGYVSILLHLSEALAYALRLHARLSEDVRGAALRSRIDLLVDRDELVRFALDFVLRNTIVCMQEARAPAARLLARYARTAEVTLALPAGRKLHLRPAGLIARIVQHHGLPVEMTMGGEAVDARQLMDVILLAAGHPDAATVGFRGDPRALSDLQSLFEHRLGEEGFETLPPVLSYLREPSRGGAPR